MGSKRSRKAVGDNIQVNANTTVKAIWKTATYTVSFDKNGGSGSMADVKKLAGETYTLPACTFTAPAGKEFKAWEVNGAEKAVGDNIQINANTTVKAIWKTATYTVSFDKNGGSGSMPEVKKTAGEIYVLPACTFTAPAGKEFKAWEVNGAEKAVGDNIQINANTTVKAIWKTATYTVSFDKNGGSGSMPEVKKTAGEIYVLPTCTFTAPAGKEFKAWEVNGVEKTVGDNIQINANTTVKAIWKDKANKPGPDPQNPSDKPGAGSQNPSDKPGKKPNKPGNSEKKPVNAKIRQNNRNNTSNNAKNPKTGESSMLSLYALAILASGGGLIGMRRKSRKEQ